MASGEEQVCDREAVEQCEQEESVVPCRETMIIR